MSDIKEIFVRTDLCTGCNSCKIGCAVEHSQSKSLFAAMAEPAPPRSRVYVEWADQPNAKVPAGAKIPVLCRHCEDAPCINACISGAITRTDTNAVQTSMDKCIGCWTCVMVCPYGVIGRDESQGKAFRCDRCPDRKTPACVEACPTGALVYDTVAGFSKAKRQTVSHQLAAGEGA